MTNTLQQTLSQEAAIATKEIFQSYMDNFAKADDQSYRRAMFSRMKGSYSDYGCSMIIEIELERGSEKAKIITKFGDVK
jgi:hypothetical protein